jgi:transcriptional regulator with XRE-family HTH domain
MSRVILRFFQIFLGEFMNLKERIKTLCKENGITVNKLEKTLGFGTGYVAKLDNSVPNTAKIQLIADYFNVSVDYLLTGEEKENKMPIFEYSSDIMELIKLYSQLNKEQKSAILNMMRSFALTNQ